MTRLGIRLVPFLEGVGYGSIAGSTGLALGLSAVGATFTRALQWTLVAYYVLGWLALFIAWRLRVRRG